MLLSMLHSQMHKPSAVTRVVGATQKALDTGDSPEREALDERPSPGIVVPRWQFALINELANHQG
jgi:hypothetical protein